MVACSDAGSGGAAAVQDAGPDAAGGGAEAGRSGADGAATSGRPAAGSGGTAAGSGASAGAPAAPCSAPADRDSLPEYLAQTGCMSSDRPTQLADLVIPYEVNSPLWSDGADKQRGLRLPAGGKIHVKDCAAHPDECAQGAADNGKWLLPVGSVLVKSFAFDGKLLETRLFAHLKDDSWVGYTYRWNEMQTQAKLVPDDRVQVSFDTGKRKVDWSYPNRVDCMKCHNPAGGSSLGLETSQLNRGNQLAALAARGVFDAAPKEPYAAAYVTPYKDQAGEPPASASLETRARSYLHANCAYCHRPDGDFPNLDLRYTIGLKETQLCGTAPLKGDVGVPTATNLTPGQPMQSISWLRMAAKPGEGRMPQIGTARVDEAGLALIGDWIRTLKTCP